MFVGSNPTGPTAVVRGLDEPRFSSLIELFEPDRLFSIVHNALSTLNFRVEIQIQDRKRYCVKSRLV
jgi:hypothetical protein